MQSYPINYSYIMLYLLYPIGNVGKYTIHGAASPHRFIDRFLSDRFMQDAP